MALGSIRETSNILDGRRASTSDSVGASTVSDRRRFGMELTYLGAAVVVFVSVAVPQALLGSLLLSLVLLFAALYDRIPLLMMTWGVVMPLTGTVFLGYIPSATLYSFAILVGLAGRATLRRRPVQVPLGLFSLSFVLLIWFGTARPFNGTAILAGFSMATLPAMVGLLRMANDSGSSPQRAVQFFAFGLTLSVGRALLEVNSVLSTDYQQYLEYRVFDSSLGSSNYAAAWFAILGVLLLSLALSPQRRLVGSLAATRLIFLALAVPFLVAPFWIGSRGSSLAIAVALLFLLASAKSASLLARATVVALVVIVTTVATVSGSFFILSRLGTSDAFSDVTSGRVILWQATIEIIEAHPLMGLGPGKVGDYLLEQTGVVESHNVVIYVLASMGIFIGVFYLYSVRPRPLGVWSVVSAPMLAAVIISMVEPIAFGYSGGVVWAGLLGCHWGLTRASRQVGHEPHRGNAEATIDTSIAQEAAR